MIENECPTAPEGTHEIDRESLRLDHLMWEDVSVLLVLCKFCGKQGASPVLGDDFSFD